MPCCCRQWQSFLDKPLTQGKTAVELYSIVGLSTATRFPGLGDFLQEGKRVTITDKNRRQVLLLLGDNGGLCYETFGTLLEGLDNTGFY